MSETAGDWTACRGHSAYWRCALSLTGSVGTLLAVLLPFAAWHDGMLGAIQAVSAAGLCLLPGLIALRITSWCTEFHKVLPGLLLSMGLRLIPPLMICLVLAVRTTGFEYIGFITYLLLFYTLTLAFETYYSVRLIQTER